jgi:hypothetical protein
MLVVDSSNSSPDPTLSTSLQQERVSGNESIYVTAEGKTFSVPLKYEVSI